MFTDDYDNDGYDNDDNDENNNDITSNNIVQDLFIEEFKTNKLVNLDRKYQSINENTNTNLMTDKTNTHIDGGYYGLESIKIKKLSSTTQYILLLIIRILIPMITVIISTFIPHTITLINIIGGFFSCFISLIMPILCFLVIFKHEITIIKKIILIIIVFVGVILGFLTIYYSQF